MMKKMLRGMLCSLCLGSLLLSVPALALNAEVVRPTASADRSGIRVSGEADCAKVQVEVWNGDQLLVSTQAFPVTDGRFSGTVPTGALPSGSYTVKYADLEGGAYATETVTVSTDSGDSGGGASGSTTSTYRLTFDTNGGSKLNSLSKPSGTTVDLEQYVPEKDGCEFAGWYSDARLTKRVTTVKLTGNVTVYAKWVEKSAVSQPQFIDVPKSEYYYDAVLWAVAQGITNGTSETAFSPNMTCGRGQMVTFLWRAAGKPEPGGKTCPFTDVAADAYYYKAVLWAVEQGITNGTSATTFGPEETVTRSQAATFLWRSAGSPSAGAASPFEDVEEGAFYYDAVQWAASEGVTKGTSDTAFSPDAPCTRSQIVTFLYRHLG